DPVLLVPELDRPRAVDAGAEAVADVVGWTDAEDPYQLIRSMTSPSGSTSAAGHVAVSDRLWAGHLLRLQRALAEVSVSSASCVLSPLRAVKDPSEVDALRRAGLGADRAFELIIGEGFEGRTEAEVAEALAAHLLASGHDTVGFTIVGSGLNGASPHHEP